MVLAESISIDPAVVVLVLAVLAVVLAVALAIVVVGIVAGYRSGRDPARRRAHGAWVACVCLEVLACTAALFSLEPIWIVITAPLLASSLVARAAGRATTGGGEVVER